MFGGLSLSDGQMIMMSPVRMDELIEMPLGMLTREPCLSSPRVKGTFRGYIRTCSDFRYARDPCLHYFTTLSRLL